MKATAIAHPNLAFIKYWGRKDDILRLPTNGSISINLDGLTTTTTVEFSSDLQEDSIVIDQQSIFEEGVRVIKHIDRIRKIAGIETKAKVTSQNNFPAGTGLSSSASGFAALTVAAVKAAGLSLSEKELTILARQGSGSACRSIPSGYVEWRDGNTSEESYAQTIFSADYWDIADIVAVVSSERKEVPTSKGMELARTSPFFQVRDGHMKEKILKIKEYIIEKKFTEFGELLEAEALEMHAIMITSYPSLIYWSLGTLELMKKIIKWRQEGIEAYFTINTGQDIHIICLNKDISKIENKLKELPIVTKIFISHPGKGATLIESP